MHYSYSNRGETNSLLEYILFVTVFYMLRWTDAGLSSVVVTVEIVLTTVYVTLSLCIVVYNVTLSPRLDETAGHFLEPPVRVKVSESSRRNFQGLEAHLFTLPVNLWAGLGWVERNGWKTKFKINDYYIETILVSE